MKAERLILSPPFHVDIARGAKHPANNGSDDGITERTTYLIQLGGLAVNIYKAAVRMTHSLDADSRLVKGVIWPTKAFNFKLLDSDFKGN